MSEEIARLLGQRFIERRDVKAWEYDNRWEPDRSNVTLSDIRTHLAGDRTLGHYLLSKENKTRLFAFDIDFRKIAVDDDGNEWEPRKVFLDRSDPRRNELASEALLMAEGLARRTHRLTDCPVSIALSGGKGLHVYCFTGSVPAADARTICHTVLESFGVFTQTRGANFWQHVDAWKSLEIETFPKQDALDGKDLGNLMRLPLGVHRKTGVRSTFLRIVPDQRSKGLIRMDPLDALNGALPWPKQ